MRSYLLVPKAVFRTPLGCMRDILDLLLDCHVLDIRILLALHMLEEVPHHLPLPMMGEGWLRTLLVGVPLASQVVERTLGRSVRRKMVVLLLAQLVALAMPLALLGLVAVVLGGL